MRRRRSSSAACGTWTRNARIASGATGACVAVCVTVPVMVMSFSVGTANRARQQASIVIRRSGVLGCYDDGARMRPVDKTLVSLQTGTNGIRYKNFGGHSRSRAAHRAQCAAPQPPCPASRNVLLIAAANHMPALASCRSVDLSDIVSPTDGKAAHVCARRLLHSFQLVRCSLRRAQGPEPRPEIFGKELRLLPRREVPAFGKPVVIDEFGKRALRPAPWGWIEFVREDAHGNCRIFARGRLPSTAVKRSRLVTIRRSVMVPSSSQRQS